MKTVAAREEKTERRGRGESPGDAEWPLVVLADVVDFIRGVTFDKTDAKHRPVDGHIPILRAGNIGSGLTLDDDLVWVPPARVDDDQMLRVGDLAICMSSGSPAVVGKTAQLREPWRGSVGAFCGIIRPRPHVHPDFVALWFRGGAFREWRDGQSRGANIQNLRFSQFAALEIPLPPLVEQERIAVRLTEQLAAVERARGAAQSRLAAAESLPAAYLREVFEGSKDFPTAKLGDVADTGSGSTPPRGRSEYFGGSIPWVKTGELRDGEITDTEEKVTEQALADCSLPLFPAGTLLIAMYGATRGKTAILRIPATTNQACFAVRPRGDTFHLDFIRLWFRHVFDDLQAASEGRGGAQPNMNGVVLRELDVPMPPLPDQHQIAGDLAHRLAGAERLAEGIRAELAAIEAVPAALLREAFARGGGLEEHE